MTQYPLIFGRRELIEGNGYVARVAISGRALLTEEGGETWVEGIQPGGFSARGASPGEALAEFGEAFRAVLFDIAAEAASFAELQREVQSFFEETNFAALRDWEMAVQRVKTGQIEADWLVKRPADTRLGVEVVEVSRPSAANNEMGEAALAA